jgi:hypothetical protein
LYSCRAHVEHVQCERLTAHQETGSSSLEQPPPCGAASDEIIIPDQIEDLDDPPTLDPEELYHDAAADFGPEDPEFIDWESNPLVAQDGSTEPQNWDHSYFAQFIPRTPEKAPEDSTLRQQIRDLLDEIERGPPKSDLEEHEELLTAWLRTVEEKIHPVDRFVAGSFGRHVAAWEEVLSQSDRPSSRSVLSWIRHGVKPSFAGTTGCEPKKFERVKRMLKRVVGESRIDEWLGGQVPHPVEFPNHRSFLENSAFEVQAVAEMLVNSTVKLYGESERRPKVVNPLGVANLSKGRLDLDGGYINCFTKHTQFRYETLREILTFLGEHRFFSTWDFKAGYYHVLIHPRFRTYFGLKSAEPTFTITQCASDGPKHVSALRW